jgi:hypothetical protein
MAQLVKGQPLDLGRLDRRVHNLHCGLTVKRFPIYGREYQVMFTARAFELPKLKFMRQFLR